MKTYEGAVDGIDMVAAHGQHARCLAFVNDLPRGAIQVTTDNGALQAALALSSGNGARVEVSYEEKNGENQLVRVRLLDR